MNKNYFLILFLALAFFTTQYGFAQNTASNSVIQKNIEELSIYPNPVSNGKTVIYITSKFNSTKRIEFYDVLGKQIYSTVLSGRELNIANLSRGVYLLKITEGNVTETRKLVIK